MATLNIKQLANLKNKLKKAHKLAEAGIVGKTEEDPNWYYLICAVRDTAFDYYRAKDALSTARWAARQG